MGLPELYKVCSCSNAGCVDSMVPGMCDSFLVCARLYWSGLHGHLQEPCFEENLPIFL